MGFRRGVLAALLLLPAVSAVASQDFRLRIDDFTTIDAWSAHPADGVALALAADAGALRMDFDIPGGGWAIARRELKLPLPDDYVFSFRIRGDARPNHLEFKLVDASGENVWWHVKRDLVFTADWQTVRIKKRQLGFAWGPQGGGEIQQVAAIEFAITAGQGGAGSVWIDDLALETILPGRGPAPPTVASASSGEAPARVLDGDPATAWTPAPADSAAWLRVDLGRIAEFSGLALDWLPDQAPADYQLEASLDGERWDSLAASRARQGRRDLLFAPEAEARYLRLRAAGDPPATGRRPPSPSSPCNP